VETKEILFPLFRQTLKRKNFQPYVVSICKILKQLSLAVEIQFQEVNFKYLEEKKENSNENKLLSVFKYNDWKGIEMVYLEILEEAIKTGDDILAIEKNEELDVIRKCFFEGYIRKRIKNKIKACVINPDTPSDRDYKKMAGGAFTKIMTLGNFDFEDNIIVTGDVVITFSVNPTQGTIRRNRKEANTFKALFWRVWNAEQEEQKKNLKKIAKLKK